MSCKRTVQNIKIQISIITTSNDVYFHWIVVYKTNDGNWVLFAIPIRVNAYKKLFSRRLVRSFWQISYNNNRLQTEHKIFMEAINWKTDGFLFRRRRPVVVTFVFFIHRQHWQLYMIYYFTIWCIFRKNTRASVHMGNYAPGRVQTSPHTHIVVYRKDTFYTRKTRRNIITNFFN